MSQMKRAKQRAAVQAGIDRFLSMHLSNLDYYWHPTRYSEDYLKGVSDVVMCLIDFRDKIGRGEW